MSYTLRPATHADATSIATIQNHAFYDPHQSSENELGLLLKTDPLSPDSSRSEEENIQDAATKTKSMIEDEDHVVVVATSQENEEVVAFVVWIKPVKGGVKSEPTKKDGGGRGEEKKEEEEKTTTTLKERFGAQIDATRKRVMEKRPHWFLKMLCVKPKLQRRGIGTQLLQWGLDRARGNEGDIPGPFAVYLESSPAGVGAYEKAGFKTLGIDRIDEPRAKKGYIDWPYLVWTPDSPTCERGLGRGQGRGMNRGEGQ